MIINTGMRTDIPAYYSEWFKNRISEGYVMVRNPFQPQLVTRYELNPKVVDLLVFCSKNPAPMLRFEDVLRPFRQFWFVTVTPYGKEIEPNVPDKYFVLDTVKRLTQTAGSNAVCLRYDPVFITEKYSLAYHIRAFEKIAAYLDGYLNQAVISFIDLYAKTKRNFPEAREVTQEERPAIGKAFAQIGREHGITVRSCCEGEELAQFGIDVSGCMTKEILERAAGIRMNIPKKPGARQECHCVLGNDIGAYNTCPHLCRYCYANYDKLSVMKHYAAHDPHSPFLTGGGRPDDIVRQADQYSYLSNQISLF